MSRFKTFWLFMACAYWPCFFISLGSWSELSVVDGPDAEAAFRVLALYALALIATRPQFKSELDSSGASNPQSSSTP